MFFNIKYIFFILGILSLQSCGVALQPYQGFDPYKLEAYRTEKLNQDTTPLADYSWLALFKDTILQQHIEKGLAENLDVLVAQENLKIASAYVQQVRANFTPDIGAEASYSYSNPSKETFNELPQRVGIDDIKIGGFFSWELDIWGKLKNEKKAIVATYLQSENFQRLIKSQVVADIATTYYLLLALDNKKAIIESTIGNREESIHTMVALKAAGGVTQVAVKQSEAQLYTAQALLIDIETEIKIRENALSILLGQAPEEIDRSTLDRQQLPLDLNIGIPIHLLSNRPDVLAAEYQLMNAFALSKVASANLYPTLSITGSAGLNSLNFTDLFSANALFSNVLGSLTHLVLNQRQLRTQKEVRLSEQEIALLDYKSNILNAYREVSDGVYTYQANQKKLGVKALESAALSKAIEFSEELLNQGMADYLEVLVAKDNLLQTQLEVVDLEANKLTITVDLYRALGGGWR